ncbi:CaiB/BaiF CoA transferase family protein [Rhodococcus artemisiae]|uniref:CaiB/BaiF CoA-transferase family protein n=1 Tax=Rhodococcus artemisiae TaxID=714159 RepID=A0ABU7LEB3_9NOCA|nr:CaiB/BaiF CoA-transferase family protein [Rhodococcus artemisiae]MEE2059247.1 CaiB/BaiF CoA-transferase family protein [Rhodococcus artemisiae]
MTDPEVPRTGPLAGIRVLELAGMGPGPHGAMLLADLGADVVRVQRPGALPVDDRPTDQQLRGRTIVEADLKDPDDIATVLDLVERADILVEGFRPGVTERLGLGPDDAFARNPRLVYARVTGWGQTGPRALEAGHDLNYISLTGLLHAVGRAGERPVPPLNLFGDFGGGSMFLVVGVLAALVERQSSGRGQVIDAAMVNGAPLLGHLLWSMRGAGKWSDERGTNIFDGSAPFYDTYECADGRYVAVGALEPQFYAEMLRILDLDADELGPQRDPAGWPGMRKAFTDVFLGRTRDEWAAAFEGVDACVTPVLDFEEASSDPHLIEREVFAEIDGVVQPAPAPAFSRTPAARPLAPPRVPVAPEQIWR